LTVQTQNLLLRTNELQEANKLQQINVLLQPTQVIPPGPTIVPAFVQGASVQATSLAYPSNNTVGNFLFAIVRVVGGAGTTCSMSDTKGNVWIAGPSEQDVFSHSNWKFSFYALNCASGANTVSPVTIGTINAIAIGEYSGVALTNALDGTPPTSTQGQSQIATGPAIATTGVNDLILFGAEQWQDTALISSVSGGYTLREQAGNGTAAFGDQVGNAGTYTPVLHYSDSGAGWMVMNIAFFAA